MITIEMMMAKVAEPMLNSCQFHITAEKMPEEQEKKIAEGKKQRKLQKPTKQGGPETQNRHLHMIEVTAKEKRRQTKMKKGTSPREAESKRKREKSEIASAFIIFSSLQ